MSIALLELGAAALDDLLPEVVFLGGSSIELWITDPAAPPVRPTKDVDVVVRSSHELTSMRSKRGCEERGSPRTGRMA